MINFNVYFSLFYPANSLFIVGKVISKFQLSTLILLVNFNTEMLCFLWQQLIFPGSVGFNGGVIFRALLNLILNHSPLSGLDAPEKRQRKGKKFFHVSQLRIAN